MQEAAGAFAHLRDVAALRVEQPRPVDISPECASMLERLCLAQAQECVFEKARADKKSSALLARYTLDTAMVFPGPTGTPLTIFPGIVHAMTPI